MLNIPDEVKSLFSSDKVRKNFHVHFPGGDCRDLNNDDVMSESVQFTESLCSQQYFKFGLAEASQIEFTAVGIPNILGSTIECAIEIDCTSLGSEWAEENPIDDTLEWLEPQPCILGREIKSVSGSYVEFEVSANKTGTIKTVELEKPVQQAGSGDPTPSNVRPFSYISATSVYIGQHLYDTASATQYQISLSGIGRVYQGTIDPANGTVVVKFVAVDISTLTWERTGANTFRTADLTGIMKFVSPTDIYSVIPDNLFCSQYTVTARDAAGDYTISEYSTNTSNNYLYIKDARYNTIAAFTDAIANAGIIVVYELLEPITYQISPVSFQAVSGADKMWYSGFITGIFVEYVVGNTGEEKLYYRIPYGRFIVDSCPRDHSVMARRKIVGYTDSLVHNSQIIQGEYPVPSLSVSPFDAVSAFDIDWSLEEYGEIYVANANQPWIIATFTSTAETAQLEYITGIYGGRPLAFWFGAGRSNPLGVYAFHIEYNEHDFDQYNAAFFNKAISTLPSGAYVYKRFNESMNDPVKKVYKSTAQAVASETGSFQPSLRLTVYYCNDERGTSHSTNIQVKISKPVFFKNGDTIILDLRDFETAFSYYINTKGTNPYIVVKIEFQVPMVWSREAAWSTVNGGTYVESPISGWSEIAPFESERVLRDGKPKIYIKNITSEYQLPKIVVNNTLKYQKNSVLGDYYTYYNAESLLDITEGTLELIGQFLKIGRTGEKEFYNISDSQTAVPVTRSQWEEFWWDENDVEPIGQVNVKYSSDGGEAVEQFTIGDGASIYTMEDNAVLNNTSETATEIQIALETYFEPNASVINFTPVDLTMKGLPYLEAGDKIELTADDGETVETYILEQTISGIQHLRAEITSTNGELLEVSENE